MRYPEREPIRKVTRRRPRADPGRDPRTNVLERRTLERVEDDVTLAERARLLTRAHTGVDEILDVGPRQPDIVRPEQP